MSFEGKPPVIIVFRVLFGIFLFFMKLLIKSFKVLYKKATKSIFTAIDLL